MDKSLLVVVVCSLITGGVVGVVRRSDPKPYLMSLGLSIGIAIGLPLIFTAGWEGFDNYSRHSELGRALAAAIGGGILVSFGLIFYCPLPAIAGCLLGKLFLYEKNPGA